MALRPCDLPYAEARTRGGTDTSAVKNRETTRTSAADRPQVVVIPQPRRSRAFVLDRYCASISPASLPRPRPARAGRRDRHADDLVHHLQDADRRLRPEVERLARHVVAVEVLGDRQVRIGGVPGIHVVADRRAVAADDRIVPSDQRANGVRDDARVVQVAAAIDVGAARHGDRQPGAVVAPGPACRWPPSRRRYG